MYRVKKFAPPNPGTISQRKARVAAVVTKAKAVGKKIPRGVKLIDFREPTGAERKFSTTLVPLNST